MIEHIQNFPKHIQDSLKNIKEYNRLFKEHMFVIAYLFKYKDQSELEYLNEIIGSLKNITDKENTDAIARLQSVISSPGIEDIAKIQAAIKDASTKGVDETNADMQAAKSELDKLLVENELNDAMKKDDINMLNDAIQKAEASSVDVTQAKKKVTKLEMLSVMNESKNDPLFNSVLTANDGNKFDTAITNLDKAIKAATTANVANDELKTAEAELERLKAKKDVAIAMSVNNYDELNTAITKATKKGVNDDVLKDAKIKKTNLYETAYPKRTAVKKALGLGSKVDTKDSTEVVTGVPVEGGGSKKSHRKKHKKKTKKHKQIKNKSKIFAAGTWSDQEYTITIDNFFNYEIDIKFKDLHSFDYGSCLIK